MEKGKKGKEGETWCDCNVAVMHKVTNEAWNPCKKTINPTSNIIDNKTPISISSCPKLISLCKITIITILNFIFNLS